MSQSTSCQSCGSYLLQSVARTTHSPAWALPQLFRASRRAVSRSLRQAAPACFPSSVVANAPHIRGPTLPTTLQSLAPHSPSATSSARFPVGWFQLTPYLPVSLSHASAPYPAAAGPVGNSVYPKASKATTIHK